MAVSTRGIYFGWKFQKSRAFQLEKENAELKAALKPFAEMYKAALDPLDQTQMRLRRGYSLSHGLNVGSPGGAEVTDSDYRRAFELVLKNSDTIQMVILKRRRLNK